MHIVLTGLVIAASLLFVGCSEPVTTSTSGENGTTYIETFPADGQRRAPESLIADAPATSSQAHHDFAFAHYHAHTLVDENTLSAPFDLQQLLTMVALGAAGTTLDTFSNASHFDFLNGTTFAGLSLWEQQVDALASVERQRMLWGQQRYRFAEDFLQAQVEFFGPLMTGLDFQTNDILAEVTINAALNGELELTEISTQTRLVSAQTTRVASTWSPDISTEPVTGRFGAHDEQRWVEMARMTGTFNVAEGESYRAVEVPFTDPGLTMVIITPTPGEFVTVRNGLDTVFWHELRGNLAPVATTLHVPLFSLARELTRSDRPDLGDAMNGSTADFSPINNAGFLYLEPPRQHIALTIDEQGLSATTATAAVHTATEDEPGSLYYGSGDSLAYFGMILTMGPTDQPCFYPPDQPPFLFAIYATETDTLLYLGQVLTLEGQSITADWTVPSFDSCGDSPLVDVYQYTGSLQCDSNSGTPLGEMAQTLTHAGIEVLASYESYDGQNHTASCGSSDGAINVYTIHESQLTQAEELGFNLLSTLPTAP